MGTKRQTTAAASVKKALLIDVIRLCGIIPRARHEERINGAERLAADFASTVIDQSASNVDGGCPAEKRSSVQGSAVLLYPRTSQKPGLSSALNSIERTNLALFHPYSFGITSRTGPPCSRGSGWPSYLL